MTLMDQFDSSLAVWLHDAVPVVCDGCDGTGLDPELEDGLTYDCAACDGQGELA